MVRTSAGTNAAKVSSKTRLYHFLHSQFNLRFSLFLSLNLDLNLLIFFLSFGEEVAPEPSQAQLGGPITMSQVGKGMIASLDRDKFLWSL